MNRRGSATCRGLSTDASGRFGTRSSRRPTWTLLWLVAAKVIPQRSIWISAEISKRFHLGVLKFKTATKSVGQADDIGLVGIIGAPNFRSQRVASRKFLKHLASFHPVHSSDSDATSHLLREILAKLSTNEHLIQNRDAGWYARNVEPFVNSERYRTDNSSVSTPC